MPDNAPDIMETSMKAVNDSYQSRVGNLEAAKEGKVEEAKEAQDVTADEEVIDGPLLPEVVADEEVADEEVDEDEDGPTPDMSWTKEKIVDYFVENDSDVGVDRGELEKLTKTQLLDRLTDYPG